MNLPHFGMLFLREIENRKFKKPAGGNKVTKKELLNHFALLHDFKTKIISFDFDFILFHFDHHCK